MRSIENLTLVTACTMARFTLASSPKRQVNAGKEELEEGMGTYFPCCGFDAEEAMIEGLDALCCIVMNVYESAKWRGDPSMRRERAGVSQSNQ